MANLCKAVDDVCDNSDVIAGFEGRLCEVDIGECGSNPCLSGGRCFELSWETLYGTEPLLPELFDPQHAAGFVCRCQSGLKGNQ